MSARIAGFAILAAEVTAVATHADGFSKPVVGIVLVAVQVVAILWATDPRSAVPLRTVAPAALTGVTVTAAWTTLALAVPLITTGDAAALAAIVAAGLVAAASSRHSPRLLPLVLLASAGTALLIFLVIESVLPSVPGYVSNNHAPIYTPVTRMVDPIGEFITFVLLAAALGLDLICARIRTRRAAAREQYPRYGTGPNEMVIERTAAGIQPTQTQAAP